MSFQPADLLHALTPRLRAYLRVFVGDEAEDVLQDAFASFLAHGPREDEGHARGWLFHKARALALNHLRSRQRRRRRESLGSARLGATDAEAELPIWSDELERLDDCLRRLGLPLRELLHGRIVEELSLSALAERTGIPRSTVALRCREALVLLHRCFHARSPR